MKLAFATYGPKRIAAILLTILALTYELGTPGHTITELVSILVYLAAMVEACTFAWSNKAQKGTT